MKHYLLLLVFFISSAIFAELPDPLDLSSALATVDGQHPVVIIEIAKKNALLAQLSAEQSANDFSATFQAQGKFIDPPAGSDLDENDSRVSISLGKTLYDFNRSSYRQTASEYELAAQEWQHLDAVEKQRIVIAQRFFAVILADLRFVFRDEAMASAFVKFDRIQERHVLGQVSDIDVLAAESYYQEVRLRRYRAENEQRSSRGMLAQAMNRFDNLPANVFQPELKDNQMPLLAYEQLLGYAQKHNWTGQNLRQQIMASQKRQRVWRAQDYPSVYGNISAYHYEQITGSRSPLVASITFSAPLHRSGHSKAEQAQEAAIQLELQARMDLHKQQLQQGVLTHWQSIRTLQSQAEQVNVRLSYRDLYFDRSQALYELDMATDFGDAMVQQSAAILFAAETRFALALQWMELVRLIGISQFDPSVEPASLFEFLTQAGEP